MAPVFAWDRRKEASNLIKHHVFYEAVEALHDPLLTTVLDERHAAEEKRFFSIGESKGWKVIDDWAYGLG